MRRRASAAGTSVDRAPAWWELAVCARHGDPAWWFSEVRGDVEKAKAYCRACPVRDTCLREHIGEPHGVWGGHGPDERAAMNPHGTMRGYRKCKETPGGACPACKRARAVYVAENRAAKRAAA